MENVGSMFTLRNKLTQFLTSLVVLGWVLPCLALQAQEVPDEGKSSRESRIAAARSIPYTKLNRNTVQLVRDVVDNPSFFRRMPSQQIECDPQMFTFLVRRPEVMVNIWELMGITQVSTQRTSPLSFMADDGAGTTARCDLVYGDENLHIYYGNGIYDGTMTPRKMRGRCVCILQSQGGQDVAGCSQIAGTMDVFLKLDNLGADLVARTLGPFVGKTADYNFVETAKFMSQISQICTHNPAAAQGLALQLNRVDETVREEFATIAAKIALGVTLVEKTPEPQGVVSDALVLEDQTGFDMRAMPIQFEPTQFAAPRVVDVGAEMAKPAHQPAGPPSMQLESSRRSTHFQDADGPYAGDDTAFSERTPTAIRPSKKHIFMRR